MRRLLFAAVIATASLAACSKKSDDKHEVKHDLREMTVDEVHAGLEAKQLIAVDCNSDKTRKRVGILPGAILIADEEKFTTSDLPADKATKLVFYCGGPG